MYTMDELGAMGVDALYKSAALITPKRALVGAGLAGAGFVGFNTGKGVDEMQKQNGTAYDQQKMAGVMENSGFKGYDAMGKGAPYINANPTFLARNAGKLKALGALGAVAGVGALGYKAYNANQNDPNSQNKVAANIDPVSGFKGYDAFGTGAPYINAERVSKLSGRARALLATAGTLGAIGTAAYVHNRKNVNNGNAADEIQNKTAAFLAKTAGFLSAATKAVSTNPVMAKGLTMAAENPNAARMVGGAATGAAVGAAAAPEGQRVNGALGGAAAGTTLAGGFNAIKSKNFTPPAQITN